MIYSSRTGDLIRTLTSPDSSSTQNFGDSVATDGSIILVGADSDNESIGAAYAFTAEGEFVRKIVANDGVIGDQFGFAVAVSGNAMIIGAPSSSASTGAAYVTFIS